MLIALAMATSPVFIEVRGLANQGPGGAFETIEWEKLPTSKSAAALFDEFPDHFLYAQYLCHGADFRRRPLRCEVLTNGIPPETIATSKRAFPLLKQLKLNRKQFKSYKHAKSAIVISIRFAFKGVTNEGECYPNFCESDHFPARPQ